MDTREVPVPQAIVGALRAEVTTVRGENRQANSFEGGLDRVEFHARYGPLGTYSVYVGVGREGLLHINVEHSGESIVVHLPSRP
jgi:hypothetical protein